MKKYFSLLLISIIFQSCSFFPGFFSDWANKVISSSGWQDTGLIPVETVIPGPDGGVDLAASDWGDLVVSFMDSSMIASPVYFRAQGQKWSSLGNSFNSADSVTYISVGFDIQQALPRPVVATSYSSTGGTGVQRRIFDASTSAWSNASPSQIGFWDTVTLVKNNSGLGMIVTSNNAALNGIRYYSYYDQSGFSSISATGYDLIRASFNYDNTNFTQMAMSLIYTSSISIFTNYGAAWGMHYNDNFSPLPGLSGMAMTGTGNGFYTNYLMYYDTTMNNLILDRVWNDTLISSNRASLHVFDKHSQCRSAEMLYSYQKHRIYIALSDVNGDVFIYAIEDINPNPIFRQIGNVISGKGVNEVDLAEWGDILYLAILNNNNKVEVWENSDPK